jgi:uncharacterized protein YndB with AHSA1/START domain
MTPSASTFTRVSDRELAMERTFDAPRELVFEAWTDADHLKQWWGPRTYPASYCSVDLRVGGAWHYCLRGPEGQEAWGKAMYVEITPPERLVFDDSFSDRDGNIVPPTTRMTLTFEDRDGKTLMRGRSLYASPEDLQKVLEMGVEQGMNETLDRLDEHLARR